MKISIFLKTKVWELQWKWKALEMTKDEFGD